MVRSRVAKVPVEGDTGTAVVSPAASTLRAEMAVSGQRLLAASGQIAMAAHILHSGCQRRMHIAMQHASLML